MADSTETDPKMDGDMDHGAEGDGAEAEGAEAKAGALDRNDDSADAHGENGAERNEKNVSNVDAEPSSENDEGGNDQSIQQDDEASQENTPSSHATESGKKRTSEESVDAKGETADEEPLPTLPLKKARTAYFIFADEKREELKQLHKGEGVAAIARATGQLWSVLPPNLRENYETQAAEERLRLSRDIQRLKDAGLWPEHSDAHNTGGGDGAEDDALIFPMARIRKICKLDPEVRGISKESALLITKATELFCVKLGKECVNMAQMQNRRKLLPEDVVEVCSMKERFLFLKDDLRDLAKEQLKEKKEAEREKDIGKGKKGIGMEGNVKTLDSYFGKAR
mmetsp:Transcript_16855/g.32102  ORF Transcript_16855/g.32102 Transcript_16855/m.32102 type:complete len:339 (-) Transcript_16855:113-1129(-)